MYNLLLEVVSKNAGLVENSVDANETLDSAVSSGSTLFEQICLSVRIHTVDTLKNAGLLENVVDADETPRFARHYTH